MGHTNCPPSERVIYKYVFDYGAPIDIAGDDQWPVHVGRDPATGQPALWVLFEPDLRRSDVVQRYVIVGTGWSMPESVAGERHVGSMVEGPFVWHVFTFPLGALQ